MAVKEVTCLRKSGKLKEALILAQKDLKENPDEWTRMSLFWVLRDCVQNIFIPNNQISEAKPFLKKMASLLPHMMDDNGAGERAYEALYRAILPNSAEIKSLVELSKNQPETAYNTFIQKFGTDGSAIDEGLHEDYGWIIYRYLKGKTESLPSNQVRRLLRDYMQLSNERPSLLHSVFLNLAIGLSRQVEGFNFYKFFLMWGADNLRREDFRDGYVDGHDIPSLISRICRCIVESGCEFDTATLLSQCDIHKNEVLEHLRQSYFWKLMTFYREGRRTDLYNSISSYASSFSSYGGSHWHSEILKLACRVMVDGDAYRFVNFFKVWDGEGNIQSDDWKHETDDKGNVYASIGVKSAKKAFQIIESSIELKTNLALVGWLKGLYSRVVENNKDDDWSIRNFATICIWKGDVDEAITLYKRLLVDMGEKYYLWTELASCISNNNQLAIGLLLKASRLEKNEDFLGDVHLSLANLYYIEGYIENAKKELETYAKHRARKSWNLADAYRTLDSKVKSAATRTSVACDYQSLIQQAEDFVFSDYDWKTFVLVEKWTHDDIEHCNLVNEDGLNFTVKSKRFPLLKKANLGEVFNVRCRLVEETIPDTCYPSWQHKTTTRTIATPLLFKRSDAGRWSTLPIKYGVIDYINSEKNVLHVLTQESKQVFCNNIANASVDSFVRFRQYESKRNGESVTNIAEVTLCDKEEALEHMKKRIVVVDDVNTKKQVFHIVLGPKLVSDIVRFDQTSIRPKIGDFVEITYCIKKNKEGKKRIKYLDISTTEETCPNVTREFSGLLEVKFKGDNWMYDDDDELAPDFAFVGDYYVHKSLLSKYNIKKDCHVTAKVVLGGDDKWKVYDLIID